MLAPVPAAARLSTGDSALTYVQARAASIDGDHARAAQLLATLADAEPGQDPDAAEVVAAPGTVAAPEEADAEGDRRFHIATFTLRLGAQRTVDIAMVALSVAYLAMAFVGSVAIDGAQPLVLAATQLAALALLWHWRRQADLDDQEAYTRFYLRVWKLFFLEYIAVPLACAV